jgi:hypothetical protein
LVRGEEALLLEEIAEEPERTFLGLPLRDPKKA